MTQLLSGEGGPSRDRRAAEEEINRYLKRELMMARSQLANASRTSERDSRAVRVQKARERLYTARLQREALTALSLGKMSKRAVVRVVQRLVDGLIQEEVEGNDG